MSDIFNKIKSVFVETDPEATKKKSAAKPAPKATKAAPKKAPVQQPQIVRTTAASTSSTGKASEKFMTVLFGALERANQDGFDYFEYKQSLRNLAKMPMDEKTRFQSAYAMAKTMGAEPTKLVESAAFYISVLQNEKAKFDQAHAQQRNNLIGGRESEILGIEEGIKQKAEQIKRLTQEIEQDQARAAQMKKEIEESTLKIEQTHNDFEVTLSALVGQIEGDIVKMQEYLK